MDAVRGAGSAALPAAALSELPRQGRVTHGSIRTAGFRDGSVLGPCKRILPSRQRGDHREYTVKTPLSEDRGAQRIVCGGLEPRVPDACHYTRDHYASFYYINE